MMDEFSWGAPWFMNEWLLSGFAILITAGLVLLIWAPPQQTPEAQNRS